MRDWILPAAAGLLTVCVLVLLILLIVQKKRIDRLTQRIDRFLQGKDLADLEQVVTDGFRDIAVLKRNMNTVANALNQISDMYALSIQKMGIVKYNAFDEMGGNLSFALALLNKDNSGLVLNSVHSSDGCYTYVKEIVRGESYVMLGNEERAAIKQAVESDNYMQ